MADESKTMPEPGAILGAKARARAKQALGRDETVGERLERVTMRGLEFLENDIEEGGKGRMPAIQQVLVAWGRKQPQQQKPGLPEPGANLTPEQRRVGAWAALADKDVQGFLTEFGVTPPPGGWPKADQDAPPVPGKERN